MSSKDAFAFLFSALLVFTGSWCSAEQGNVKAANLFFKKSDKLTLSYEEFRRLSTEHQNEWLRDLHDFYIKIDRLGINSNLEMDVAEIQPIEILPWLKVTALVPHWCAVSWAAFTTQQAHASSNTCVVRNYTASAAHAGGVCLVCTYSMGTGSVQNEQVSEQCSNADPDSMDTSKVANELVSGIQKSHPNLGINLTTADIQPGLDGIKNGDATSYNVQKASPVNPTGTFKTIITPSGTKSFEVPESEVSKPISKADPLQVVQTKNAGDNIKQTSNVSDTKNSERRKLGDTGNIKGNDNQDVDEYMARAKLACIYAGWALQGSGKDQKGKCQAVSEKEIFNEKGERTKYSCKNPPATTATPNNDPTPIVYGDNNGGNNQVLCNPVLFGLKAGKPICVARATAKDKAVTKKCADVAREADPDGKSSLPFAIKNPVQYRELMRRVETLCVNGDKETAALSKMFAAKGQSEAAVKASLQDLSNTCTVIQERMSVLQNANSTYSNSTNSSQ